MATATHNSPITISADLNPPGSELAIVLRTLLLEPLDFCSLPRIADELCAHVFDEHLVLSLATSVFFFCRPEIRAAQVLVVKHLQRILKGLQCELREFASSLEKSLDLFQARGVLHICFDRLSRGG